ncbi:cytochrome c oxidase assembly protein COX19, putative [Plasmodium ovale]|uniref:CHCH domain-containing protein n=2 Tax=Plasmodium ovale TaxID=36330 RepID=A0A1A8WY37_PLAOA|nr:hypothetical protein POVCU2_0040040 [Plasmodium ovale curtisi]SBS97282.1 hypothetical protein POVCU1_036940 [Plasmodium ovale curtisi]SCP05948.1 cytochrome c oxidase assembly protein COX19, putative [Plasmodium ovale]
MDKKRSIIKKPDRGSFLLDHNSECSSIKNNYLKCLKEHNNDHVSCREFSKEYFICRMDKNLLEKQSLSDLGFSENELNQESRIKNFKDVYSYNMYNEKLENLAMDKLSNKRDLLSKETHTTGNFKEVEKNEANVKHTNGDNFLLLHVINKQIIEQSVIPGVKEKNDEKNGEKNGKQNDKQNGGKVGWKNDKKIDETKIAVRRKEEDGYLAGKEYLKVLLEKKRKKSSVFINNVFKNSNI